MRNKLQQTRDAQENCGSLIIKLQLKQECCALDLIAEQKQDCNVMTAGDRIIERQISKSVTQGKVKTGVN